MKIQKFVEIHSLKKNLNLQLTADFDHFLSYRFAQDQVAHLQICKNSARTFCLFLLLHLIFLKRCWKEIYNSYNYTTKNQEVKNAKEGVAATYSPQDLYVWK